MIKAVWRRSEPLLVIPLAGLLSIIGGWGVSALYNSYRIPLLVIVMGNLVLAGSTIFADRISPLERLQFLARLSVLIAVLMVGAYAFAFFGVRFGAFKGDAPYLMISALYLSLPAVLLVCALVMRRVTLARRLAVGLLLLIGILGGYCAYVMLELLAEVPSILEEHLTVASQVHFYNTLMLLYIVLGSLTIAAGLWRAYDPSRNS